MAAALAFMVESRVPFSLVQPVSPYLPFHYLVHTRTHADDETSETIHFAVTVFQR